MKRLSHDIGVAGFTLVEMLAATVLMGIVLSVLGMVTAQWLPNWNRGFARVQRAELLNLALDRLVGDVAAAEFVTRSRDNPRPLFEGSELAIIFVRTALGPNSPPGLEVVRISETVDRLGTALVRSRTPFVPVADASELLLFVDPVVVLRVPYRVTFSYAGPDRVWKSIWAQAGELPSAVRFTVRNAQTERALDVSTSTSTLIHHQAPAVCVKSKSDRRCGRPAPKDSVDEKSDVPTTVPSGGR
jgi:general secretion pathway protein J